VAAAGAQAAKTIDRTTKTDRIKPTVTFDFANIERSPLFSKLKRLIRENLLGYRSIIGLHFFFTSPPLFTYMLIGFGRISANVSG
jgi:hypothetical protein